uniref:Uncharacterized protein n=1 Tax=Zea mays TaxID=4577 RepID=C4J1K7_MAIZE|nr:unknown [Zea mays]
MGRAGTCPAPGPTESSGGRAHGHAMTKDAAAPSELPLPGTAVRSLHLTPTTRRPCSCRRHPPSSNSSGPRPRPPSRSLPRRRHGVPRPADRRCSHCSRRSAPAAGPGYQNSSNYVQKKKREMLVPACAYHVEEAGPALLLPHAALPEEELLRVAGDLRRGPRRHVAPGDASPVALAQLVQAGKELPVLLLAPWNSWRRRYISRVLFLFRNISCYRPTQQGLNNVQGSTSISQSQLLHCYLQLKGCSISGR